MVGVWQLSWHWSNSQLHPGPQAESLGLAKAYQGHTHSNKVASVESLRAILNQTTTHTTLAPKCRLPWSVPVTVESAANVDVLALAAHVFDT